MRDWMTVDELILALTELRDDPRSRIEGDSPVRIVDDEGLSFDIGEVRDYSPYGVELLTWEPDAP